ncbi:Hypothetical predicted protein [Xyrichtys novacula]|uniref:Uncharacterized protein n=1 Tax=Xyrichtys novacula TaxID=13765 RepID=A0AAV1FVG3_XYRNO|nr:Hypothetical predicted protein [Xyrichtys novacula]
MCLEVPLAAPCTCETAPHPGCSSIFQDPCLRRQGGSGVGSQPDLELVQTSRNELQQTSRAWLPRSGLLHEHTRGVRPCLSVCTATKQASTAQQAGIFWPQSMHACVSDASVTTGNMESGGDSKNTEHAG